MTRRDKRRGWEKHECPVCRHLIKIGPIEGVSIHVDGTALCPPPLSEIVGPAEVAAMAGVKLQTVYAWAGRRKVIPEPFAIISGTRLWRRDDIGGWLAMTGRPHPIPKHLQASVQAKREARDAPT